MGRVAVPYMGASFASCHWMAELVLVKNFFVDFLRAIARAGSFVCVFVRWFSRWRFGALGPNASCLAEEQSRKRSVILVKALKETVAKSFEWDSSRGRFFRNFYASFRK